MSIKTVGIVFESEVLSDQSETLVMLALADWADDEGVCYPSMNALAQKARMSRRGVQYVLDRLREKGLVDWDENRGRGNTNRYFLSLKNLQRVHVLEDENMQDVHVLGEEIKGAKCASDDIKCASDDTKTCKAIAPEPSRTVKEPSAGAARARARGGISGFSKPTVDELRQYARKQSLPDLALDFWEHFENAGWIHSNGRPMMRWDLAYNRWCRREPQFSGGTGGAGARASPGGDPMKSETRYVDAEEYLRQKQQKKSRHGS